ncbi:MAG: hypothetical protein IJ736_05755 [Firmicutes bacterium]|nr:hypothetical protein [Bacillota bacterium]
MISNRFFKENPIKELSAANFAYFSMAVLDNDELNDKMGYFLKEMIDSKRATLLDEEAEKIKSLEDSQEILLMMKKLNETQNRKVLINKIISKENEVMPLIVKRYLRIRLEKFIETAAWALYLADEKYTRQLYEEYEEIAAPYAQAFLCLIIAMKKIEGIEDFLMNEYKKFKKNYPDESFCEFPLLGLHLICDKY